MNLLYQVDKIKAIPLRCYKTMNYGKHISVLFSMTQKRIMFNKNSAKRRRTMKKMLSLVLVFGLLFTTAGCSKEPGSDKNPQTASTDQMSGEMKSDGVENKTEATSETTDEKVTELKLEDFGGSADGITDNMPAMTKLTNKLKYTAGKKRLVFGEGAYRFVPADNMHAISINSVVDLEIVGQGPDKTHIIIGNSKAGFFHIRNSKNISTKGLSVDHDPLPFTQGTIVAVNVDDLTYDMKIDEGFGVPSEEWFTADSGASYSYRTSHIMDRDTGNFKKNTVNNVFVDRNTKDLGNRVYRFSTSKSGFIAGLGREAWGKGQIQVGDRMVVLSRASGAHNLFYDSCENTLFENINVYSSTGFALMNSNTKGTAVARKITIKRKENRLISLCSDGINFTACRAKPLVEDCYIEANCDDSISGQAGAPTISVVENSSRLFVQNFEFAQLAKGDRVTVFNQREGRIVGETKIAEITPHTADGYGNGYMVTLEAPVEGITPSKDPASADLLMSPEIINSGITIRNTTVAVKGGRGVFLHSQDMLIENCTFKEIGGQALMLANEGPSRANGYTSNVTIKNNTFENSAYCEKIWDMWAPIHIGTLRGFYPNKGDRSMYISASEPVSDNINILNNKFINSSGSYIFLSAVKNAVIEGNTMKTDPGFLILESDAAIIAENCSGISIKNNEITDQRAGLKAIIEARGNTPKDDSGIKLDGNTFNCTPGASAIK